MPTEAGAQAAPTYLIQNALESILAVYPSAREQDPGQHPEVPALFQAAQAELAASPPLRDGGYRFRWSVGERRWTASPYVAWMDPRETRTARTGLFASLVFATDMSKVYLVLQVGAEEARKRFGTADGLDSVRSRVKAIRLRYPSLREHGFVLDAPGDLGGAPAERDDFEAGVVLYKPYLRNRVPEDARLLDDVGALTACYQDYISSRPEVRNPDPSSWVLRVDPRHFDLQGAVRQLDELRWPVGDGEAGIEAGDRAFLFEAGPRPGVVALASVVGDPDDGPRPEVEEKFLLDAAALPGPLSVRLRIDRVLPERLTLEEWRGHPHLAKHGIARGDEAPLQRLDGKQAASLRTLADRTAERPFEVALALPAVGERIADQGYRFEPWQLACYAAALRTKPFVILAGVSGTGKSKLPALLAEATGGRFELMAVRPDWTDSSDVLGYVDLQHRFRPGRLLEVARRARNDPAHHYTLIVDEMNLARVEHYFAEVLAHIEDRRPAPRGGFESSPLLGVGVQESDQVWAKQTLPPNLALVGTVNMDESAHGFSRKVLDRAFTMEFSDIDLSSWSPEGRPEGYVQPWPVRAWYPRAVRLGGLRNLDDSEQAAVERVVTVLGEANRHLLASQLQVGYRTRDEVALFVLHARELADGFVTREGHAVDPLDLALQMKILPRLSGGSHPVRCTLRGLLGWAFDGRQLGADDDGAEIVHRWEDAGRPFALEGARMPRTAARLALMWDRLQNEGFTSFWL